MSTDTDLVLHVPPADGEDDDDLLDLTRLLRQELLDLDVEDVQPLEARDVPDAAKGVATLAGWLAVQLGSVETVRAVVDLLRGWAGRRRRDIEVTIGGDTLKLTAASAAEQEHIIDAWLARHAAGA